MAEAGIARRDEWPWWWWKAALADAVFPVPPKPPYVGPDDVTAIMAQAQAAGLGEWPPWWREVTVDAAAAYVNPEIYVRGPPWDGPRPRPWPIKKGMAAMVMTAAAGDVEWTFVGYPDAALGVFPWAPDNVPEGRIAALDAIAGAYPAGWLIKDVPDRLPKPWPRK